MTYKLPEWMEKYRDCIINTGGNKIEDLVDRLLNEKGLAFSNIIVYVMTSDVYAQIGLLTELKEKGFLK